MAWSRSWLIDSKEKLATILRALLDMSRDPARHPWELIARELKHPKSDRQRRLFHAAAADLGKVLGSWPGDVKRDIKRIYFGDDYEEWSTEDLDHEEYGELIECLYSTAANLGIFLPDRRRG